VDSHSSFAAAQLPGGADLVDSVIHDMESAPVSSKLRALLRLARVVSADAQDVTQELIDDVGANGASDTEIHDTVLIAAAFVCTTAMSMV